MNNYLLILALITQLTGLTLPAALDGNFSLVPTINSENQITYQAKKIINDLPTVNKINPPILKDDYTEFTDSAAKAAIVTDAASGQVLWQKNQDKALPIASITKLMTALVFLDHNPGWDIKHKMLADENYLAGANLAIGNDQELSMQDIIRTTLVGSANNTAKALSRSSGLTDSDFALAMNAKAKVLGMQNYNYVEPTGLDANNKASAHDLAILFKEVINHPELREIMSLSEHKLLIPPDNHEHTVKSTVKIMKETEVQVLGGKTGFTYEAGYCLVTYAKNEQGKEIIVVDLGLDSEESRDFANKELIQWTFENYLWQ